MHARRTWVAVATGLVALAIPASATAGNPARNDLPRLRPLVWVRCHRSSVDLSERRFVCGAVRGGDHVMELPTRQPSDKHSSSRSEDPPAATASRSSARVPSKIPALGATSLYGRADLGAAGDVIGFYTGPGSPGQCGKNEAPSFTAHAFQPGDHSPGSPPVAYSPIPVFQLSISAILEPDADNDGFGDETQDACPTGAATQTTASRPRRRSPRAPRTRRRRSRRRSSSAAQTPSGRDVSSARSTALRSRPAPRRSRSRGRRARTRSRSGRRTPAGNVDATPATDDWKVKKKKKK